MWGIRRRQTPPGTLQITTVRQRPNSAVKDVYTYVTV